MQKRKRQPKAAYEIVQDFTQKEVNIQKIADWLDWRVETDPATDQKTAISKNRFPRIEMRELNFRPKKIEIEIRFIPPEKSFPWIFCPTISFPKASLVKFIEYKFTKNGKFVKRAVIHTDYDNLLHSSLIGLTEKNYDTFSIKAK